MIYGVEILAILPGERPKKKGLVYWRLNLQRRRNAYFRLDYSRELEDRHGDWSKLVEKIEYLDHETAQVIAAPLLYWAISRTIHP